MPTKSDTNETVLKVEYLRKRVDELRTEQDRATGALEQVLEQLQTRFGCSTLKEAEAKLTTWQEKATIAEKEFTQALAKFEKEWGGIINDEVVHSWDVIK